MDKRGFTLIELMIALAIIGIIISAIFDSFLNTHKTTIIQERVSEIQQIGRMSIDMMSRDLRLAGMDPDGTAGAGISFLVPCADENPGDVIVDLSFDIFHDCNGDNDVDDANESPDGTLNTGCGAAVTDERVVYYWNSNTLELERVLLYDCAARANELRSLIAENISSFTINYNIATQTAEITLQIRDSREDPEFFGGTDLDGDPSNGTARQRTFNTTVLLRNMIL